MLRPLVVVRPRIAASQREYAGRHDDVAGRFDLREPPRAEQPRERERLRHRLSVLQLVLRHHVDEERVEIRQKFEHRFAHLADVRPRLAR